MEFGCIEEEWACGGGRGREVGKDGGCIPLLEVFSRHIAVVQTKTDVLSSSILCPCVGVNEVQLSSPHHEGCTINVIY